jgi:type VI secretion system protein ImpD
LKTILIDLAAPVRNESPGHGASRDHGAGWPDLCSLCALLCDVLDSDTDGQTLRNLAGETTIAIDREIGRQLTVVMTHPLFLRLESAWRGLDSLLEDHQKNYTNSVGADCFIEMVDCSAAELSADLPSDDMIKRSWLYDSLYTQRLDQRGGKPLGVLIGGMEFGGDPPYSSLHEQDSGFTPDQSGLGLLRRIAAVAELSLCPFVAGASPGLLDYADFSDMPDEDRLNISSRPPFDFRNKGIPRAEEWAQLRLDSSSRFVGLVAPRIVLAPSLNRRRPQLNWFGWPAEVTDAGADPEVNRANLEICRLAFKPLFGSGAYALAAVIVRSVCDTGWPSEILGVSPRVSPRVSPGSDVPIDEKDPGIEDAGGLVSLPGDSFLTDPPGVSVRAPVEVSLTGEQERRLGQLGLVALSRVCHTDRAAFYTMRMLHKPDITYDPTDNATQEMHSILPYMLTASRFAQFVKVCIRREHGTFKSAEDVKFRLNDILGASFLGDGRPLAAVEVKDVLDAGNGTYSCNICISPRLMAEDVKVNGMIAFRLTVAGKLRATGETEPTES